MARAKENSKRGRHQAKDKSSASSQVPDVYKEMLVDTISSATRVNDAGKIIKRRRVAGQIVTQGQGITDGLDDDSSVPNGTERMGDSQNLEPATQQTAYNDSEDSAESDLDWEEINLTRGLDENFSSKNLDNQTEDLSLVLDENSSRSRRQERMRRVPVTAAERRLRLETHKIHLLSLLVHLHLRNHWCNQEEVHGALKGLLSTRTLSYLNPDEKNSQFQRSRSFIDGLRQASETFREKFRVTSRGMSRSKWAANAEALADIHLPEDLELPMQKSDFCAAANTLEASRDVGAQLFCALLRSACVETRLVCSLQPLPFNVTAIPATSHQKEPTNSLSQADAHTPVKSDKSYDDARENKLGSMPKPTGSVGSRRILSSVHMRSSQTLQGGTSANRDNSPPRIHTKRTKESPYPVFWVEAFNEADQKWIPVDSLVTRTVSKPSSFEPPASDSQNSLNYVLAFESDGSARDVTRRYAKAFNAKTRRGRLEVVQGGEIWWRRVLKMYTRAYELPRDQIEDSELIAREAAEPMPKNVLDFKNHPYYALERHLKRSEVIHPKREVGKVAVGRSGGQQILEPVFRRRDVQVVKSGDSWYRLGQEVKIGEQPLKHVPARRGKEAVKDNDGTKEEGDAGTALYAYHQTKQYSAPPVINGRIPKNIYGNLDIYVSSMVPRGGVHIPHPDTSRAARLLGVDYADAVSGFAFKGRHGTAIITGAVVAESCRDAVEEVISAFEMEKQEEEEKERTLEALRTWKKFLIGLRIRERIQGYEIEGERKVVDEEIGDGEESARDDDGGGFVSDREMTRHSKPVSLGHSKQILETCDDDNDDDGGGGGGFLLDDEVDDEDGAKMSKPGIGDFHKTPWRSDCQDPEGQIVYQNLDESSIVAVGENKRHKGQIQSSFQSTDRTNLPIDTDAEARRQESTSSVSEEADKAQAPIKQRSQPQRENSRTAKASGNHTRSLQNESSRSTSASYLSQTIRPPDPSLPSPPSKPYHLPDADMAEALALQQIHDSQSLRPLPPTEPPSNPHPEANLSTSSHIPPHSPHHPHPRQKSASSSSSSSSSSSPPHNAPPNPTPQLLSSPPNSERHQITITDTKTGSPVRQAEEQEEDHAERNKLTNNNDNNDDDDNDDDDESEDAESLLSRDPSDDEADPSWLDF